MHIMDILPEPTADTDPKHTLKPAPEPMPEPNIAPESDKSDQLRKLATSSVPMGILVENEGMVWSPAHNPAAEGDLCLASVLFNEDLEEVTPLHVCCSQKVPNRCLLSYPVPSLFWH